jgi:hypothetical protein
MMVEEMEVGGRAATVVEVVKVVEGVDGGRGGGWWSAHC